MKVLESRFCVRTARRLRSYLSETSDFVYQKAKFIYLVNAEEWLANIRKHGNYFGNRIPEN